MTTVAVRLPDELLEALDALVTDGRYANRTAAVREALDRLVADERRRALDSSILDGYARKPPEPADALTRTFAERSVELEPG